VRGLGLPDPDVSPGALASEGGDWPLLGRLRGTPHLTLRRGSEASAIVSDTAFLPHSSDPSQRQNVGRATLLSSTSVMLPPNRFSCGSLIL